MTDAPSWTCAANNPNQKWTFTPGKYPTQIKLAGTNMCLGCGKGESVRDG